MNRKDVYNDRMIEIQGLLKKLYFDQGIGNLRNKKIRRKAVERLTKLGRGLNMLPSMRRMIKLAVVAALSAEFGSRHKNEIDDGIDLARGFVVESQNLAGTFIDNLPEI